MKKTMFIAGIVGVAVSVTAMSVAADGGTGKRDGKGHGGHKMSFSALDIDGNGEITQEEMMQTAGSKFDSVDTDGDGALSRAEMEAQAQAKAAERIDRMMQRFDENEDGKLARDEMPKGGMERMFERADADNSGGVSKEEFAEMRKHGKRGKHGKHGGNWKDKN